jgi:hypothetical protein
MFPFRRLLPPFSSIVVAGRKSVNLRGLLEAMSQGSVRCFRARLRRHIVVAIVWRVRLWDVGEVNQLGFRMHNHASSLTRQELELKA